MIRTFRALIFGWLAPFLFWVGRLHWPFSHRRLSQSHVKLALGVLLPGDVIITEQDGAPSNLLIPGDYTHAAVYSPDTDGSPEVIEATSPGVHPLGLYDFLMTKDRFMILRSTEGDAVAGGLAAHAARSYIGRRYDIMFRMSVDYGDKLGDLDIYCAELAFVAWRDACPQMTFRPRLVAGAYTIEPMDFARSPLWRQVLEVR